MNKSFYTKGTSELEISVAKLSKDPLSILLTAVKNYQKNPFEDTEKILLEILELPKIKQLPYIKRNKFFLTSSKLKEFKSCSYHAKLQFIDELPTGQEDEDYFVIGQAVDDRLTYGQEYFDENYEVVSRRSEEAEKKQLTKSSGEIVNNCVTEYLSRDFFPKKPQKKNILWMINGILCKAELDHLDIENRRIEDTKTCANIATFDPRDYILQMAFYSYGINKKYGEQVEAALNVVDKHSGWSRSHKWIFSRATLQEYHYEVERLVSDWKRCVDSGIWPHVDAETDQGRKVCWASPYYSTCQFCKSDSPTIL